MIGELAPAELAAWRADAARAAPLVVDVREPWEVAICRIAESLPLPMAELPKRLAELPQGRELVMVCHHGGRSLRAAQWLAARGYAVHNLRGGIAAWKKDIEPSLPAY